MEQRIIMHVDSNSAYLSWTAAAMLEQGASLDIRTVPAVIAGDPANRHGIILAKSIPAKKAGIGTAMSLGEARALCPDLLVFRPDYDLYLRCSDAMYEVLERYSSRVQRYSIDECFLDYTESRHFLGDPLAAAHDIQRTMKEELGFTVNIGVSVNKILAKMGSEMEKPDKVHTLFPEEMPEKLWPQPVSELFMVGRATTRKLLKINIRTIGELAAADPAMLRPMLKSHGDLVWRYANGIDDEPVDPDATIIQKSVGNAITVAYDVEDTEEADQVLLALSERVGMRLRRTGCRAGLVAVSIRSGDLEHYYSHQHRMDTYLNDTTSIYRQAQRLYRECWRGEPVRQMGVSVSDLRDARWHQISVYDLERFEQTEALSHTVDGIRRLYGEKSIIRGTFVNTPLRPIDGGVNDGNYLMMGGYRSEDLS